MSIGFRVKFFFPVLIVFMLGIKFACFAQETAVSVSGVVKAKYEAAGMPYANVILKTERDSVFVGGTVTNDEGRFTINNTNPGNYVLELSFVGYKTQRRPLYIGSLTPFLDLATIEMEEEISTLSEIVVEGKQDAIREKLDKKTYSVADNISQGGGSVIQAMQNLPGVTIQEGKVLLRGNDRVAVLIDGKQTALTGFGNQTGLDNLPASAIDKIEIINNPSAKFDANGNAGIINIIFKKNNEEGFNGKAGLSTGLGSWWVRKANFPGIRPQYKLTPKVNPSLSLNYRKHKINAFFQGDYLYTETLNKNEFVTRAYDTAATVKQQTKRNRDTGFTTTKAGIDWSLSDHDLLTISGLYSREVIIDRGDEPFFNDDFTERLRLWQFLEDEVKTTVIASAIYQHKYIQPGRLLNVGFNYTFHREDEKYFFTNTMPTFIGEDAFKLISDESVGDLTVDYVRPLRYGKFEGGMKLRLREIPTNMQFIPGINSPLDVSAGGPATYQETIPALYGNYVYEDPRYEAEVGLRMEYVKLNYVVGPNHPTYASDGYNYTQPFPNVRLAYKFSELSKVSLFYNRRVDRPNEVDIRIFPKYDDAEIIKVGNPALKPQFTNTYELGYKKSGQRGYLYGAVYHKMIDGTIVRIGTTVKNSNLIYNVFQNAGLSYNTGIELLLSEDLSRHFSYNINLNAYHNQIDAFTVENKYPVTSLFSADNQEINSWSLKVNGIFHFPKGLDGQISVVYLAPDIIPQGRIDYRFSLDAGLKKMIQKGR